MGLILLGLYALLRPRSSESSSRKEPTLFGRDSTEFGAQTVAPAPATAVLLRGQRAPATQWSARVFDDIEWRRFEALCASLFGQAGFEARSQSHGADGGVDIWLYSQHADGPAAIVQCKHWLGKPVGVKELREFYGVMASHKLLRGTFATTSTYTPDARQFAKNNGITALDGQGLLALISRRTPQQQKELLEIAYEGEYWRPTCASCGIKMVDAARARTANRSGAAPITRVAAARFRCGRRPERARRVLSYLIAPRASLPLCRLSRYHARNGSRITEPGMAQTNR
jgi:restriction system protein